MLGLDITESAVCKFLGFTHHKLATYVLQRDDTPICVWCSHISTWNTTFCGYQQESIIIASGESHWRPSPKLFMHGEHISCIAAMSMEGIVAIKITGSSVDSDAFYNFVRTSLLRSFPLMVQIITACLFWTTALHHVDEVDQAIRDCGVITIYHPTHQTT